MADTQNEDGQRQAARRRAGQPGTNRKIAVLAVHHVQIGDQRYHGGAEKYLRLTVQALLDAGAAVHVGYSGTNIYDDLVSQLDPARLAVERTDWIDDVLAGDSRLNLRTILARRRWLRGVGADTAFAVQQAGGGAFAASLVAARSLGMRTVMSLRQSPEPLPPPTGKHWLGIIPSPELWRRRLTWRRRLPARCCHAIIFNSRRIAEAYRSQYGYPAGRLHVIPNGEVVREARAPAAPGTPCNIGTVGRISQAKGADTLLEAFAGPASRHPGSRLIYFGDGPLIPELQAKARQLGLADRVVLAGYQPDHEEIYNHIDIYVQPSRRESMSNSVIEAMARGIPCVVTDVGGLPETVLHERTGLVVPAEDVRALAAAVDRLLSDQGIRIRFGAAGQERVRREFALGDVMRRTVEAICGVAMSAPPARAGPG